MIRLWQDLRYGMRVLAKTPGFTVTAVLTLALGIGANTAIFSLIDAVMLRSTPVRDSERLVVFSWTALHTPDHHSYSSYGDCGVGMEGDVSGCSFSVPMFERFHSEARTFSGLAAFAGPMQFDLSGNGPARMARGEIIAGDYFSALGVSAAAGRLLGPEDNSPSAAATIVLSYGYWQSMFGGDASAVGKVVRLNGVPFRIVGVAERHFTNLAPGKTQDFWLPLSKIPKLDMSWLAPEVSTDPETFWVLVVGRLKAGISLEQAQAEASSIFSNELLHGPRLLSKEADKPSIALAPVDTGLHGGRRRLSSLLCALMSAVALVLLIACANVAGLTLARSTARQKEIAVRLALGAGRLRIAKQLLVESVLLSLTGGVFGVLLAYWGVDAITALLSSGDQAFPFVIAPDWRVLAFTISVCVVTGVVFGLAPAFKSARVDLTPALKENVSSVEKRGRRLRLGDGLVVAQVALSIVVLVGAGLLVRTLQNLRNIDPGFDTHNVLLFGIAPGLAGYNDARTQRLYADLQNSFAAIPGVTAVSYAANPLLSDYVNTTDLHVPGQPEKSTIDTDILPVGFGFFATMRIGVLAGRTFTPADFQSAEETSAAEEAANEAAGKTPSNPKLSGATPPMSGAPVPAIINEAFADKYFSGRNPLGQHLDDGRDDPTEPKTPGYQIVGVTRNTKYNDLKGETQPAVYVPLTGGRAHFELRTAVDPGSIVPVVRDIVNRVDTNLPLFLVRTQSAAIDELLKQERLIARLSSCFAVLALVLACVGLYGLLAYDVSRRTREIGIRMALGAQRNEVLRMVVRQGIILAIVGTAAGMVLALGVARYLATLLYGVRPFDPVTFAVVAILLFAVAAAACYVPARRATRVDPLVALRYE